MIAIFCPDGSIAAGTVGTSRKAARRAIAERHRCKWNELWLLGYRVRSLTA